VVIEEQIWCSPTQSYIRPLTAALEINPQGKSRRLQRALTDFGCEQSFARAAASLREHYGFDLGPSAVRTVTLQHARKAKEQLEKSYAQPFRNLPAVKEAHVIAEVDGTMICTVKPGRRKSKRPREWKEMRLVAAKSMESASAVYAATFGCVAETGRRWGHCAKAAGWGGNSRIHAVGDGAEWIRIQCKEVFGSQGHFLCDFYHVSEDLGAAAQSCRPLHPNSWRRTQQKRLRRGAADKVMEALLPSVEAATIPDELAPVRNAHRYIGNRLDCLDYLTAQTLNLPIGSGMIESGHRHVLQARLKKAGTAWLPNNAEDLAQLRVLRANELWQAFWN
jgi:hypothetical protein